MAGLSCFWCIRLPACLFFRLVISRTLRAFFRLSVHQHLRLLPAGFRNRLFIVFCKYYPPCLLYTSNRIGWFPMGKKGKYTRPSAFTSIGAYAFKECSIEAFYRSDNVKTLGQGAFMDSQIKEIHLGAGIKLIPTGVFQEMCIRDRYSPKFRLAISIRRKNRYPRDRNR